MGNPEKEIKRLKERNERLNDRYKKLKEDVESSAIENEEQAAYLKSMIEDITAVKAEFESLQMEMKQVVQDLKCQKLQYHMLINQTIELKNEMLKGIKMPFLTKLKYKFKNK